MRASRFQVVLLPSLELLARYCTLREAVAFARGYHEVIEHGEVEATVCPERVKTCEVLTHSRCILEQLEDDSTN